ncbi:MAG: 30S ribosomal protein S20 [Pseudomonadota bacterium]
MATDRLKKKLGVGRHLSSIKRSRQSEKRRVRNRSAMSNMKTAIKSVRTEASKDALKKAVPVIMKTAKKGIIHRRKADRLVSRLTKYVNSQTA